MSFVIKIRNSINVFFLKRKAFLYKVIEVDEYE